MRFRFTTRDEPKSLGFAAAEVDIGDGPSA